MEWKKSIILRKEKQNKQTQSMSPGTAYAGEVDGVTYTAASRTLRILLAGGSLSVLGK